MHFVETKSVNPRQVRVLNLIIVRGYNKSYSLKTVSSNSAFKSYTNLLNIQVVFLHECSL